MFALDGLALPHGQTGPAVWSVDSGYTCIEQRCSVSGRQHSSNNASDNGQTAPLLFAGGAGCAVLVLL